MNSFNLSKVLFTFVVFVAIDSAYLISMKGYFDEQIKQIPAMAICIFFYFFLLQ